jgi:hypothetical protein
MTRTRKIIGGVLLVCALLFGLTGCPGQMDWGYEDNESNLYNGLQKDWDDTPNCYIQFSATNNRSVQYKVTLWVDDDSTPDIDVHTATLSPSNGTAGTWTESAWKTGGAWYALGVEGEPESWKITWTAYMGSDISKTKTGTFALNSACT